MLYLDTSRSGISSFTELKAKLAAIKKAQIPVFDQYKEDLGSLKTVMHKYRRYKNLILIGNGGSNTSLKAYHSALVPLDSKKKLFILTTMEPDLLDELRHLFPRWRTLVMPVSKSGTTIGLLESLFAFPDYKMLPVTSPTEGALSVIAKKEGLDIIPHPNVGGRFSGLTSSALAPALFFNIDIDSIENGARAMYARCAPSMRIEENPALQLACVLYLLEKKRYSEIFCPIYSSKLAGFSNLIVQLMHESVCKKGRGQTIYCADAPESQHHTNQRFFGGKKNVLGLFVTVNSQHDSILKVKVPESVKAVEVRGGLVGDIDNVPYQKSLEFEFEGTYRDAVSNRIPCIKLSLDKISAFSVGEFIGFWHYVAVYSSLLRDVDPYDQPQVESSKDISFSLRKEHKK
jgi:glucose-6-phosphate isomerase